MRALLARGLCTVGVCREQEAPALGEHQAGCLTRVPCAESMWARPGQHHDSQPRKPRFGGGPCCLCHAVCRRPTAFPSCSRQCGAAGALPSGDGGATGSSVKREWEQGLARREGATPKDPRQGLRRGTCGLRPRAAGRSEVRGEPTVWPFTLSKVARPSEVCVRE